MTDDFVAKDLAGVHVVRFDRLLDSKVIVSCSCGWRSEPMEQIPRVYAGGIARPSATSVAFAHVMSKR